MNCSQARERMLEADPAELAGHRHTPLADHLAGCAACRRDAARIVDAEDALRAHLAALVPRRSPREVVRVARRASRRVRLVRRALLSVPALAAASVVLFLARTPEAPWPPLPAEALAAEPPPLVEVPAGSDVAVIATDNPDIVVVWFF